MEENVEQQAIEEPKQKIKEKCEIIKKVCRTLNCMNKENTVTKQEIINELEMTYNIEHKKVKQYFATAKSTKLLKKYKGKYYYDETDEQMKVSKVENVKYSKGSYKLLICAIIVAIIIGVVTSILNTQTGESYVISGTDIKINTTSDQLLYDTKEELVQYFGEEYANYYTFAVIEKNSSKYELYGTLISKTEIGEEYDINALVQTDRDYVASILGEESTSQVSDIKLGENNFKTYNYIASDEVSGEYIVGIYIADIGEQYLLIEFYADKDIELSGINNIMIELFK